VRPDARASPNFNDYGYALARWEIDFGRLHIQQERKSVAADCCAPPGGWTKLTCAAIERGPIACLKSAASKCSVLVAGFITGSCFRSGTQALWHENVLPRTEAQNDTVRGCRAVIRFWHFQLFIALAAIECACAVGSSAMSGGALIQGAGMTIWQLWCCLRWR